MSVKYESWASKAFVHVDIKWLPLLWQPGAYVAEWYSSLSAQFKSVFELKRIYLDILRIYGYHAHLQNHIAVIASRLLKH